MQTDTFFILLILIGILSNTIHSRDLAHMVIFRHGDRTPLERVPSDLTVWNCSDVPAELSQTPLALKDISGVVSNVRFAKYFRSGIEKLPGTCMTGQLTSKGMRQHFTLGTSYGKQFGSDIDCQSIYMETTDRPRTIQSLESFMSGFFDSTPRCLSGTSLVKNIFTVENDLHDMFQNYKACPKLPYLLKKFQDTKKWKDFHAQYQYIYDKVAQVFEFPSGFHLQWYELYDFFTCRASHGVPLPAEIPQEMVHQIEEVVMWEYRETLRDVEYLKLSIGAFAGRLVRLIDSISNTSASPQLYLFSGHDTTLAPLLTLFGLEITVETWPIYASHIHIRVSQEADQKLVTLTYNDKPLHVCSTATCEFSQFVAAIKNLLLEEKEWQKDCHSQAQFEMMASSTGIFDATK